jgi:hypothetical protein
MDWEISDQARDEYQRAVAAGEADTVSAYDALLHRVYENPTTEGLPLIPGKDPANSFLKRVLLALARMNRKPPSTARASYQTMGGHRSPPPPFAFSVHVPKWKPDAHLLLALGRQ